MSKAITINTNVHAPLETVWNAYTQPEHITAWNHASDDWHCPSAQNDLRVGGRFGSVMAAKDGSMQFEFWGHYTSVNPMHGFDYTMGDGRKATVKFESSANDQVNVVVTFEMESQNSEELQRGGWQAILENFKKYTESLHA